ncbi:MAG: alanine racemase [Francisella endosymbiont of Hyalomma scupense]
MIGISITKPIKALELAKAGIKNLLIVSPIVTNKKREALVKILRISPETIVVTNSLANVEQLNTLEEQLQQKINILIDIDADISRTGISFTTAFKLAIVANEKNY